MAFYIKNKEGQILTSGGFLEIGDGLKVEEEVLKADVGSDITVDNELKTDSPNPVENQVVTQRINEIDLVTSAALNDLNNNKADKDNFKTINGESIIGSGNIEIESSGGGTIDNIEVNGILGESKEIDELSVASVNITGLDVLVGEDFAEPTDITNENLLIKVDANDPTIAGEVDTVSSALGKLQKALKDDEAAITRAFLAIENSTGFNDNLEYVPEESTTILGTAKSLQDADAILMNNLIQLSSDFNTVKSNQIRFSGGASSLVKFNEIAQGGTYNINIPYEGNCTNVTYRFPPATYASGALYYTISTVINSLEQYLLPPLIFTGRIITFETAAKTWEWWLYVGPMSLGDISPADWSNMSNWKQLNISYVASA